MQWLIDLMTASLLGFLAGIGTGGGSLLILWLTLVRGFSPEQTRTINLMFFIPSAIIATVINIRKKTIHLKKVLPAIIAGCIAAALTSFLGKNIDTEILRKMFGGLLIFAGLREITYKQKNQRLRKAR